MGQKQGELVPKPIHKDSRTLHDLLVVTLTAGTLIAAITLAIHLSS